MHSGVSNDTQIGESCSPTPGKDHHTQCSHANGKEMESKVLPSYTMKALTHSTPHRKLELKEREWVKGSKRL